MTARTIGAHNLHDAAGVPTFFADVVLFTEAVAPTIIAKARAARARASARLAGYTIRVCKSQRDLVVALKRRHYKVTAVHYFPAHGGRAEVTPHRGTFVVETIERVTGRRVVFIVEHRINAAFAPYVRGESRFRQRCWGIHLNLTLDLIERYTEDGWQIRAGGDLNTPSTINGYQGTINEAGHGFDRLGSNGRLSNFEVLSRKQSDHPRIRAVMD